MNSENILLEKEDRIAKIILNRPDRMNALNLSLREDLETALKDIYEDEEIRVVIITGAEKDGKKRAFSSGDDLMDPGFDFFSSTVILDYYNVVDKVMRLFNFIDNYPKPVIAMVNGVCIGGAIELALSCDFIIASESAEFTWSELNIGMIPGWGGTQRLTRKIGESKAKRLIFTGDTIKGDTAKDIGLVDILTQNEKLNDVTMEFAKKLADKSPIMLRLAKISIEKGMECSLQSGLFYEILGEILSFKIEDMMEGMSAYLEKRKPEFKGR